MLVTALPWVGLTLAKQTLATGPQCSALVTQPGPALGRAGGARACAMLLSHLSGGSDEDKLKHVKLLEPCRTNSIVAQQHAGAGCHQCTGAKCYIFRNFVSQLISSC
jgi:hypothetical protein